MPTKTEEPEMTGRPTDSGDVFPRPDPTVLTNQLVDRAISNIREILIAQINGNHAIVTGRLDQGDKAVALLQNIADRIPQTIRDEIGHLEKLHDERFRSIDTRIIERDDQVKQSKADAKVGIDAALASAEKLVGQANDSFREQFNKSESSTKELLNKQDENQKTEARGLAGQIAALKERMDRMEGAAVGVIAQKTEAVTTTTTSHANTAWIVGLGLAAIAAIEFLSKYGAVR